jgi:hypothetical protein
MAVAAVAAAAAAAAALVGLVVEGAARAVVAGGCNAD